MMRYLATFVGGFLAAVGVLSGALVAGDSSPGELGQRQGIAAQLSSHISAEREGAVQSLLSQRKELVEALCEIVHQKNAQRYTAETRAAAAFLLGEMRAPEAVEALNSALADNPVSPLFKPDASPYDFSVSTALAKIGRPAVPEMVKNLRNSDDRLLLRWTVVILVDTLGGREHTLELIGRLIEQEQEPAIKERLKAAKNLTAEMLEGCETPLY
jgi:HEAT repeat protein